MADVTPILIKDLAAQTTLQDTDYFIVGGEDAKKITVAQMKEALGINDLNSKLKPYTRIFASTNLSESGIIEEITDYNDFIILVSASGFITSHFATKEVLINGPIFASSYYYNASQHGMASIQLYAGGAYQIGKGINQNSSSSSVTIYAR